MQTSEKAHKDRKQKPSYNGPPNTSSLAIQQIEDWSREQGSEPVLGFVSRWFTSGSTGQPKGVLISHRAFSNWHSGRMKGKVAMGSLKS